MKKTILITIDYTAFKHLLEYKKNNRCLSTIDAIRKVLDIGLMNSSPEYKEERRKELIELIKETEQKLYETNSNKIS